MFDLPKVNEIYWNTSCQVDVNLAVTSCRYRCDPVNEMPFEKRETETCTM